MWLQLMLGWFHLIIFHDRSGKGKKVLNSSMTSFSDSLTAAGLETMGWVSWLGGSGPGPRSVQPPHGEKKRGQEHYAH